VVAQVLVQMQVVQEEVVFIPKLRIVLVEVTEDIVNLVIQPTDKVVILLAVAVILNLVTVVGEHIHSQVILPTDKVVILQEEALEVVTHNQVTALVEDIVSQVTTVRVLTIVSQVTTVRVLTTVSQVTTDKVVILEAVVDTVKVVTIDKVAILEVLRRQIIVLDCIVRHFFKSFSICLYLHDLMQQKS
jgi:hypothetical protein